MKFIGLCFNLKKNDSIYIPKTICSSGIKLTKEDIFQSLIQFVDDYNTENGNSAEVEEVIKLMEALVDTETKITKATNVLTNSADLAKLKASQSTKDINEFIDTKINQLQKLKNEN